MPPKTEKRSLPTNEKKPGGGSPIKKKKNVCPMVKGEPGRPAPKLEWTEDKGFWLHNLEDDATRYAFFRDTREVELEKYVALCDPEKKNAEGPMALAEYMKKILLGSPSEANEVSLTVLNIEQFIHPDGDKAEQMQKEFNVGTRLGKNIVLGEPRMAVVMKGDGKKLAYLQVRLKN